MNIFRLIKVKFNRNSRRLAAFYILLAILCTSLNPSAIDFAMFLVVGASLFTAMRSIFNKRISKECPLILQIFVLNLLSSIIFLVLGLYFFGLKHFADVFVGRLWVILAMYSFVVLVLGQIFWFSGIKNISEKFLGNSLLLKPIAAIFFAFFIVGEIPTRYQILALAIIILGLLVNHVINRKRRVLPLPLNESQA